MPSGSLLQRGQGGGVVRFLLDLGHQFAVLHGVVLIEHDHGARAVAPASGPVLMSTP